VRLFSDGTIDRFPRGYDTRVRKGKIGNGDKECFMSSYIIHRVQMGINNSYDNDFVRTLYP
jgi:hypothetical protein